MTDPKRRTPDGSEIESSGDSVREVRINFGEHHPSDPKATGSRTSLVGKENCKDEKVRKTINSDIRKEPGLKTAGSNVKETKQFRTDLRNHQAKAPQRPKTANVFHRHWTRTDQKRKTPDGGEVQNSGTSFMEVRINLIEDQAESSNATGSRKSPAVKEKCKDKEMRKITLAEQRRVAFKKGQSETDASYDGILEVTKKPINARCHGTRGATRNGLLATKSLNRIGSAGCPKNRESKLGRPSSSEKRKVRENQSFHGINENSGELIDEKANLEGRQVEVEKNECCSVVEEEKVSRDQRKPESGSNSESELLSTSVECEATQLLSSINTWKTDDIDDQYTNMKMSYELRNWMSIIIADVKKINSCLLDERETEGSHVVTEKTPTCAVSSNSNHALEKFQTIFQDLYISKDQEDGTSDFERRKNKLDYTHHYIKAAIADARLDSMQKWHLRDPRNRKLKPSLFL